MLVGTLSAADGLWKFEYSDEFRQQDELRPLVEFPDVDKDYESKELWQFFVMRIPSPEQPEVEEILKREHIKEDDAVSLLRRFGEHTIRTRSGCARRKFLPPWIFSISTSHAPRALDSIRRGSISNSA